MAYITDISEIKDYDKVEVTCDDCGHGKEVLFICARRQLKRRGGHYCASCAAKRVPRPQNSKAYWTAERKKEHSESIKTPEYYEGIAKRDQSGEKNGMFGKEHSTETRAKMSKSRVGKIGPNATAWKGGRRSLTRRVKEIIHTRLNWYGRVYARDGWTCTKCPSKQKIDAHHKEPIVKLIKRLAEGKTFESDEQKIEWLVSQPEIADPNLENGVTLCRECHKKEHGNWGSHERP